MTILICLICKFYYENLHQIDNVVMDPFANSRQAEKQNGKECDVTSYEPPMYTTTNPPQIMCEIEGDLPEYFECGRASPLPSYDDIIYHDRLCSSMQNLLA
ncbi:hypothetical protein WR25_06151 [Diploscapter pachys]|uniref:Uncharacterized protein n=1 Tax=Diploscapter pachys TaxID=2018661 RepID=A0A2A2KQI5_9BILA|nr:hypothetical protein WR25_06151 [Diploscapter pachys]